MKNKPLFRCINPEYHPMTLGESFENFFEVVARPFQAGSLLDRLGNTMLDIGMGALQEYYKDQEKKKNST